MSLRDFQRALCDLIASPELCVRLRIEGERALAGYELTRLERRRLGEVVRQRGMSTSCTLYRANRLTPLHAVLPCTCALLGESLEGEVSAFWRTGSATQQFGPEVERFADHLRARVVEGALASPYLLEILDFELAVGALEVAPRLRLLASLQERLPGQLWERNPLLRVLRFIHDPATVLAELTQGRVPAAEPDQGDFYLLVSRIESVLEVRVIDPRLGILLATAGPSSPISYDSSSEVAALVDLGMLVPV